jgi:hypothetical protein
MVDRISFNEFTRLGDVRTTGIIWANTFLSRSVKAVVTAQDAPHTTERHQDA